MREKKKFSAADKQALFAVLPNLMLARLAREGYSDGGIEVASRDKKEKLTVKSVADTFAVAPFYINQYVNFALCHSLEHLIEKGSPLRTGSLNLPTAANIVEFAKATGLTTPVMNALFSKNLNAELSQWLAYREQCGQPFTEKASVKDFIPNDDGVIEKYPTWNVGFINHLVQKNTGKSLRDTLIEYESNLDNVRHSYKYKKLLSPKDFSLYKTKDTEVLAKSKADIIIDCYNEQHKQPNREIAAKLDVPIDKVNHMFLFIELHGTEEFKALPDLYFPVPYKDYEKSWIVDFMEATKLSKESVAMIFKIEIAQLRRAIADREKNGRVYAPFVANVPATTNLDLVNTLIAKKHRNIAYTELLEKYYDSYGTDAKSAAIEALKFSVKTRMLKSTDEERQRILDIEMTALTSCLNSLNPYRYDVLKFDDKREDNAFRIITSDQNRSTDCSISPRTGGKAKRLNNLKPRRRRYSALQRAVTDYKREQKMLIELCGETPPEFLLRRKNFGFYDGGFGTSFSRGNGYNHELCMYALDEMLFTNTVDDPDENELYDTRLFLKQGHRADSSPKYFGFCSYFIAKSNPEEEKLLCLLNEHSDIEQVDDCFSLDNGKHGYFNGFSNEQVRSALERMHSSEVVKGYASDHDFDVKAHMSHFIDGQECIDITSAVFRAPSTKLELDDVDEAVADDDSIDVSAKDTATDTTYCKRNEVLNNVITTAGFSEQVDVIATTHDLVETEKEGKKYTYSKNDSELLEKFMNAPKELAEEEFALVLRECMLEESGFDIGITAEEYLLGYHNSGKAGRKPYVNPFTEDFHSLPLKIKIDSMKGLLISMLTMFMVKKKSKQYHSLLNKEEYYQGDKSHNTVTVYNLIVEEMPKQFSKVVASHVLKLSPGKKHYHNHIRDTANQKSNRHVEHAKLLDCIKKVNAKNPSRYGAAAMAAAIDTQYGHAASTETVRKAMKALGISFVKFHTSTKSESTYRGPTKNIAPNRTQGVFDTNKPFARVDTDITFVKSPSGVLTAVQLYRDNFNSEILVASASQSQSVSVVVAALKQLKKMIPAGATCMLHTDRGWQYMHDDFVAELESDGRFIRSMSGLGLCTQNGATESLNGVFKEYLERELPPEERTPENVAIVLEKFVPWYNNERPHSKNNGMTPVAFKNAWQAAEGNNPAFVIQDESIETAGEYSVSYR